MAIALQLVAALVLIYSVVVIGGLVGGGIEDALGEKPLRDRERGSD